MLSLLKKLKDILIVKLALAVISILGVNIVSVLVQDKLVSMFGPSSVNYFLTTILCLALAFLLFALITIFITNFFSAVQVGALASLPELRGGNKSSIVVGTNKVSEFMLSVIIIFVIRKYVRSVLTSAREVLEKLDSGYSILYYIFLKLPMLALLLVSNHVSSCVLYHIMKYSKPSDVLDDVPDVLMSIIKALPSIFIVCGKTVIFFEIIPTSVTMLLALKLFFSSGDFLSGICSVFYVILAFLFIKTFVLDFFSTNMVVASYASEVKSGDCGDDISDDLKECINGTEVSAFGICLSGSIPTKACEENEDKKPPQMLERSKSASGSVSKSSPNVSEDEEQELVVEDCIDNEDIVDNDSISVELLTEVVANITSKTRTPNIPKKQLGAGMSVPIPPRKSASISSALGNISGAPLTGLPKIPNISSIPISSKAVFRDEEVHKSPISNSGNAPTLTDIEELVNSIALDGDADFDGGNPFLGQ